MKCKICQKEMIANRAVSSAMVRYICYETVNIGKETLVPHYNCDINNDNSFITECYRSSPYCVIICGYDDKFNSNIYDLRLGHTILTLPYKLKLDNCSNTDQILNRIKNILVFS